MSDLKQPEKLNGIDPTQGQPVHPEYHRGRRHEAMEHDAELAALRAERDAEIERWQEAIRNLICARLGPESDARIDGGGCESGDPLDLTLAEVGQGLTYLENQLRDRAERAESDAAESKRGCGELWTPLQAGMPDFGLPVLGYAPHWVDEDFCPSGVRECHLGDEGWTSAAWAPMQDVFYTDEGATPTHWMPIPSTAALTPEASK